MKEYHEERLLIITKTYPTPSKSYRETVCVAAVNEQKELRRLYPIAYRFLKGEQKFKRWQWIRAKIARSSDRRPESYNLDNDSIQLQEILTTKNDKGWKKRIETIKNHIYPNFSTLEATRIEKGISFGIIKPHDFKLVINPARKKEWDADQLIALRKDGLFDPIGNQKKPIVKKIPFDIYYEYQTDNDQNIYKHLITDWEIGALFWNCQKRYKDDWELYFRKKLEDEFRKKDLHLLMGTMHVFQNQWLIIGLIYPPKEDQQLPLFE